MISILIPAYKTEKYIEECLDSIKSQTYFKNNKEYEVIVGVDACLPTLNKLLEIRGKYPNLKIASMDNNGGLFITLNTLLTLAKYDHIIKFDSDDIMLPTLVQDVIDVKADLVRFMYYFYDGGNKKRREWHGFANGVYYINRKVYNILGGYQPWKCAADTEFLQRFNQINCFKEVKLKKRLFLYRQHNGSLTRTIPMSQRISYHKKFKGVRVGINVKPTINKYKWV